GVHVLVRALAECKLGVSAGHGGPSRDLSGHCFVESRDLSHLMARHVDSRSPYARTINIEVDNGPVPQFVPIGVRVPGRAGITPVAVTRPPGKTNAISKSAIELFEDTC